MADPVIADVVEACRLYLLAQTTLATYVGNRIAYEELPRADAESMPRPCIVLTSAGGRVPVHLRARTQRVDMRCYGGTIYEARIVHNLAMLALRRMDRMTRAHALVYSAVAESDGLSLRDPDTDWPFMLSTHLVFAGEDPAA